MSTEEVTKVEKTRYFENWRAYPVEVKLMDFSILAWLVLMILNVIFYVVKVQLTIRSLPMFILPAFMIVVTLGFRFRLVEKPHQIRKIFFSWLFTFLFFVILSILVLVFYPPLI